MDPKVVDLEGKLKTPGLAFSYLWHKLHWDRPGPILRLKFDVMGDILNLIFQLVLKNAEKYVNHY
jgi:hypothetical protein